MGVNQSKKEIEGDYIHIDHPYLNKIKIIECGGEKLMQIRLTSHSKKYQELKGYNCLFLPVIHEEDDSIFNNLCGNQITQKINYPNYHILLSQLIANSSEQSLKSRNNENSWYLLYILAQSANIFHSKGKKVGDIRPKNIFLSQEGGIKVGNILSWPQEITNYQKYIFNKQITYISPQQVKDACFGNDQQTNKFISQSFSVGLTLLDHILNIDSSDLYKVNNRFNYQQLENRLKYLASPACKDIDIILKDIVIGLCNVDPLLRFNCNDIYKWLKEYQSQIVSKQKFYFKNYPSFIRSNVSTQVPTKSRNIYVQSQVVTVSATNINTFQPSIFRQQQLAPLHDLNSKKINQIHQQAKQSNLNANQADTKDNQKQYKIVFKSRQQKLVEKDSFSDKLKKIEEQLEQSRKMFPS